MSNNVHTILLKDDATGVMRHLIALGMGGKSYEKTKTKGCEAGKHYGEFHEKFTSMMTNTWINIEVLRYYDLKAFTR